MPNRFGPYVKEIQAEMSKEYPFVSGYGSGACYWGKVEPANGRFNFSLCRAAIEGVTSSAHRRVKQPFDSVRQ